MKAFLIDPVAKYVEEVDYNGDYKEIYKFIECGDSPFTCITVSDLGDTLFLDDEGLFKEDQSPWEWKGYPQVLVNKALVLGTDQDGESCDCRLTREDVIRSVLFLGPDNW